MSTNRFAWDGRAPREPARSGAGGGGQGEASVDDKLDRWASHRGNAAPPDPMEGYTSSAPAYKDAFDKGDGAMAMRRRNTSDTSYRKAGATAAAPSASEANQQHHPPFRSRQEQEAGPSSQSLASVDESIDQRPRTSPTKLEGNSTTHLDGMQTRERGKSDLTSSTKDRWTSTSTTAPSGEGRGEIAGARKQNTACDACRTRKVRCLRSSGEEKCNHCKAKGIDCTTIYVQLATSGVKRPMKRIRGGGGGQATTAATTMTTMDEGEVAGLGNDEVTGIIRYMLLRDGEYAAQVYGLSYAEIKARRMAPSIPIEAHLTNATAREEFVSSLLETYFSTVHIRYPIVDPQEFLQRYHYRSPELGGPPSDVLVAVLLAWGAKFSRHPVILADRRETASEEMTAPQRIKRLMSNPHSGEKSAGNFAAGRTTVESIGGGARDRAHSGADTGGDRVLGRSRIADTLAVKAQEVLDRNKAHRVASMDNAKATIIAQALYWQVANASDIGEERMTQKRKCIYICNGSWITSAILQMIEMKVHLKETIASIADPSHRGQAAMSWWLACMFDAHMSAFYRRKPLLSAEDYSTEPPLPPSSSPEGGPSPMASEQGYRIWLNSALDQCEMMRSVYFTLWTPAAREVGVSARKLERLLARAYEWRDKHLGLVGAPGPDWPSNWRFADAVTACSSDINYQIVWLLMWQAVDEFGIAELQCSNMATLNAVAARHGTLAEMPTTPAQMDLDRSKINGMRSAIYEEALNAALRCADLSRMLCDFDYLQNEAGIMKYALCEAGYLLTQFRRIEVYKIIDGLRQYGQAFEECYEQADELEMLASEYCKPTGRGQHGVHTTGTAANVGSTNNDSTAAATAVYAGHASATNLPSRYGGGTADLGAREKLGSGLVRAGSPSTHNVLPEVGSLMIANLGHNPNHPGMHHFAHHLMQRGASAIQQQSYGPSPPSTSHTLPPPSSRIQPQPIVPSQQAKSSFNYQSAGVAAPVNETSAYAHGGAVVSGGGHHQTNVSGIPSSYSYGGQIAKHQQQQPSTLGSGGLPGASAGSGGGGGGGASYY